MKLVLSCAFILLAGFMFAGMDFGLNYGSEPTHQTITIINPHSLPKVGGDWTIYFNTTGTGELRINDHSFPEEVGFVDLYQRTGQEWGGAR